MAPLVVAMAIGPLLPWKRADLLGALGRLKVAALLTLLAALVAVYLQRGGPLVAWLGMALAAWLFAGALTEWAGRIKLFRAPLSESWRRAGRLPRSAYGMTLAHAGLAVAIAGITASAAWQGEVIRIMRPGDIAELGGYGYRLEGVQTRRGPNYTSDMASFTVLRDGREVTVLMPEKRIYDVQRRQTTEAAIHSTGLADLYAVIGDADGRGGWTVRIYHEPLVPWIWAGALIMVAGGAVSLSDRRLRVGAPTRRRKTAPATA
jgi:cytochrome c-type biogenesis protein CcmF